MEATPSANSSRTVDDSTATDSAKDLGAPNHQITYVQIQASALCVIALLMLSQALYVAASVIVPLMFAFVFALALRPVVRKLKSFGMPVQIGSAFVLFLVAGSVGGMASQLIKPASEWLARTPFEFKLRELRRKLAPIEEPLKKMNDASQQMTDLAVQAGGTDTSTDSEVQQVVLRPPSLLSGFLNSSWQISVEVFLCFVTTYFFLAEGEKLLNQQPKVTTQYSHSISKYTTIIRDVERSVSRYLLTVSVINGCLGVAVGISCWFIGIPNYLLWGFVAFALNYLPYVGAIIGVVIISLVSLSSFDFVPYAALAPAIYLSLTSIEGYFVTPSILGHSMSLNPLVVILSLVYWSWLWGISGAVLAVPLMAILISLGKQFEVTKPLATALSR